MKKQTPKYLSDLIRTARQAYMSRHSSIPHLNVKHDSFGNSFFPSTIIVNGTA